jgi:aminopeptidase YwaD
MNKRSLTRLTPFLSLIMMQVLFVPACRRATSPTFDQAIDTLFAQGYPQALETYLCSLGTNPELGFRWAGTTADRAASDRVAAEMREMGLSNVRLEPVPVDIFEFEEASLTVAGRRMTASTVGGVPPTPPGGITAPVVYVRGGTAADFDAAGDVTGKLVLIDLKMSSWWVSLPAFEAGQRGAAGVVCTYTPEDPKYYSADDRALGSFDGQYSLGVPPWIYISRRDGDGLKLQLALGPVSATMVLKEKVTLASDGGVGYNVVGEIPGTRGDGQILLLAAHQDAHFRAGADDTGGLVNMLAVAKAMRASGYRPGSTVVFLATTGEEFGYTDAYYEWIVGAWWAATRAHSDWPGRVRALLNFETMAVKGAALGLRSNPELKPWLGRLASRSADLLPYGHELLTPVGSWNDQWTFTAAGIPSVKIDTMDDAFDTLYHSNFETAETVDWNYMAKIAKFVFRAAGGLDSGVLPYSIKARADDLAAALREDKLEDSGAEPAVLSRLAAAMAAFGKAAASIDAAAASAPSDRTKELAAGLLDVEKSLNTALTGLSPADDDATVYPYRSVVRDAWGISAALAALAATPPDREAALKALRGTYLTRLGIVFSHPVYLKHIARLDPGFERLYWGEQGQLPKPLDLVPQYRLIQAGDYGRAAAELQAKHRVLIADLNLRLARMASVLEAVTTRLEALSR